MEDAVRILEGVFQETGIGNAPLHKVKTRMVTQMPEFLLLPRKEIINHRHFVIPIDKVLGKVRPDEPGTAGNEVIDDSVQLFQGNSKFVWYSENYKNIP